MTPTCEKRAKFDFFGKVELLDGAIVEKFDFAEKVELQRTEKVELQRDTHGNRNQICDPRRGCLPASL